MKRPFLTAEWRHLAMLNYEIDPAVLCDECAPVSGRCSTVSTTSNIRKFRNFGRGEIDVIHSPFSDAADHQGPVLAPYGTFAVRNHTDYFRLHDGFFALRQRLYWGRR